MLSVSEAGTQSVLEYTKLMLYAGCGSSIIPGDTLAPDADCSMPCKGSVHLVKTFRTNWTNADMCRRQYRSMRWTESIDSVRDSIDLCGSRHHGFPQPWVLDVSDRLSSMLVPMKV
jgi:hypothetical protein